MRPTRLSQPPYPVGFNGGKTLWISRRDTCVYAAREEPWAATHILPSDEWKPQCVDGGEGDDMSGMRAFVRCGKHLRSAVTRLISCGLFLCFSETGHLCAATTRYGTWSLREDLSK
ncbi:hypothetical protein LIA77_01569 [Sarocladium implicatum]|nr:hypothetical protein LIA77_01569 [Sarocladium implicatum]